MKSNEVHSLEDLTVELSKSNDDNFEIALKFKSFFEFYKKVTVDTLKETKFRDEEIGVIDFLSLLITKINQIQEKKR